MPLTEIDRSRNNHNFLGIIKNPVTGSHRDKYTLLDLPVLETI